MRWPQVVAGARESGKPLVIENLNFSKKRDLLEGESPGRSRMLSSFAYGRIKTYFLSRGYREGVEVIEVNPAYSSVMGRVIIHGAVRAQRGSGSGLGAGPSFTRLF